MARCGASAAGAQSQQAQPASCLQMPPDLGTANPHARIVPSSGEPVQAGLDEAAAARLWQVSADLTGQATAASAPAFQAVGLGLAAVAGDRSGEGVQDHGEPDLELIAEVVAGAQDVLGRHLDKVGRLAPAGTRSVTRFRWPSVTRAGVEGQGGLLQREIRRRSCTSRA